MRGRRTALKLDLTDSERHELARLIRCATTPNGMARRCRAVLGFSSGSAIVTVARAVGMTERNVRKWVRRFVEAGPAALHDGRSRRSTAFVPGHDGTPLAR